MAELAREYEQVVVNSSAAGGVHVIRAAVAGQVLRLHGFGLTASTAAAKVLVQTSSGASPTIIAQKIGLAVDSLAVMPFVIQKDGALAGLKGKNLEILSTETTVTGYAIVSLSTD